MGALTSAKPRTSVLRWTLYALSAIVALLAFAELVSWPFLRTLLRNQLQGMLGVLPMLAVERAKVDTPPSIDAPHLLQADGLSVRWSEVWRAARGQAMNIKSLAAERIDAHLIRRQDGAASCGLKLAEKDAGSTPAKPAPLPTFERLVLRSGKIAYRDETLDVDIKATAQQTDSPSEKPPWSAQADGLYRGTPVELTLQAGADLPLRATVQGDGARTPLALEGALGATKFSFDGAAGTPWAGQRLKERLKLSGVSLQQSAQPLAQLLPETLLFSMGAEVERQGARWLISADAAKVGNGVLDNKHSTLRIQGGASFSNPSVGIEAKNLLARAAGALLLGSAATPAALLAFIDTGGNDADPEPCAAPAQANTSNKAAPATKPQKTARAKKSNAVARSYPAQ